ncbi:hypothetical protein MMC29_002468, partial [Sticta canariensis]|nr:hypothetical protein [Sticta canariensis]
LPEEFWKRGRALHAQHKDARAHGEPSEEWAAAVVAAKAFEKDLLAYNRLVKKRESRRAFDRIKR